MEESSLASVGPIDSLYLALEQCFGIILCGYIAGRLEIVTKSESNGLNTFVGTFSLPSLIFLSMAKLDFSRVNWKFLLAVLIAKSLIFFIVLLISLVSTRPSNPGRSALFAIFTTQSNDFAIGYPMINALYGLTHPEYSAYLYLMAPISLVILNPIGFILLEIAKRRNSESIMSDIQNQGSNWQMIKAILKGIVLNPVLFMTVLGIIGNIVFNHKVPPMIGVILEVLGNAFSASALFLLGLMMVGKIHKLKGVALVIPGILISIKLLVLPLVIRESVVLLNAGANDSETFDLSTFGFLYGTIPTAPALFIFTLRYKIDIDLIASSMVVCTFLSAPLMFLSAKVINAMKAGVTPTEYSQELAAFAFDISIATIIACIWLMICFFVIKRKRLKSITHRCTISLTFSQLLTGIGVFIWTKLDLNSVGTLIWYIQFTLITLGIYASRIWTCAIALTLFFLSTQNMRILDEVEKWFHVIAWGGPLVMISVLILTVSPKYPNDMDLRNPNFQFGRVQEAISLIILILCFIGTVVCLIMRQRYQWRHNHSSSYDSLVSPQAESNINQRSIVDVEDLGSPISPDAIGNEVNNECASGYCTLNGDAECSRATFGDDPNVNPQILRHLVLVILLLCSTFVGISVTIATFIMEQITGIYTELSFLDVALGSGQVLIIFGIFGLDPGLGPVGCWLRQTFRKWRMEKELLLPDEESLSSESKAVRDQFRRCYLANCRARISACRRSLLRTYNSVFTGSELVNWLLEAGVAKNREEAVEYGRCLLESRVLVHVDGTQHFYDRNFFYSFLP